MTRGLSRCNVAIAGYGGVGKAVAQLLLARRARYAERYGADVRLTAVCGSREGISDVEGLQPGGLGAVALRTGLTGRDFLNDCAVDVLIEAGPTDFRTGGPGLGYMRDALSRGRHVVAVSKGALVVDGRALRAHAERAGVCLKVSGASAAALPTIDLLTINLLGTEVLGIEGILNGTTNYLLTEMIERDLSFAEALLQAQDAGIAEADPSFDVDGWDTACKLLIIANFGLGADLALADLTVGGVAHVTRNELDEWRDSGRTPKLIGHLAHTAQGWTGGVELRTYAPQEPFALVRGKNKAIRVDTAEMGEIFVAGGASDVRATAAAALKDFEHILAGNLV